MIDRPLSKAKADYNTMGLLVDFADILESIGLLEFDDYEYIEYSVYGIGYSVTDFWWLKYGKNNETD